MPDLEPGTQPPVDTFGMGAEHVRAEALAAIEAEKSWFASSRSNAFTYAEVLSALDTITEAIENA